LTIFKFASKIKDFALRQEAEEKILTFMGMLCGKILLGVEIVHGS
jgi:hypothetical protein